MAIVPKGEPALPTDRLYVDLLSVRLVSNNGFKEKIGELSEDLVLDILIRQEAFDKVRLAQFEGRPIPAVTRKRHDYDVAISFAGEQRTIAKEIATELRDSGFSVFFDEFEESNLWGADLGQTLMSCIESAPGSAS